jgi:histidinol-phosphate/aromatic aminotransferase/cobyric acid decarboxylase-like protein
VAILQRPQLIKDSIREFQISKTTFEDRLRKISKLEVLETKTTFCLAKILISKTAVQLKEQLMLKNIFIKDCSIYEGLGKQYICLGVPQERYQIKVIEAIRSLLEENLC